MRKRGTSWVASEPLEILIRIEADDMNFDRAIGVAQSPLQRSTKLAQQREYGFLIGLKAGNPVRRYACNQDERQACRNCVPHRKTWLLSKKFAGDTIGVTSALPPESRHLSQGSACPLVPLPDTPAEIAPGWLVEAAAGRPLLRLRPCRKKRSKAKTSVGMSQTCQQATWGNRSPGCPSCTAS
jgi:hypothetical protein